jgi:hypothetical protein
MIGYVDTSALLRLVLREGGALDELLDYEQLISSELIAVESCRTIDRLRLQGSLTHRGGGDSPRHGAEVARGDRLGPLAPGRAQPSQRADADAPWNA